MQHRQVENSSKDPPKIASWGVEKPSAGLSSLSCPHKPLHMGVPGARASPCPLKGCPHGMGMGMGMGLLSAPRQTCLPPLASLALVTRRIDEVPSPSLEETLLYGFSFWTVIKNNNGGNESCSFYVYLVCFGALFHCSGLLQTWFQLSKSSETRREESPLAWWTRCRVWQHLCRHVDGLPGWPLS